MAVSAGPNIIEDGLVLCLDAANKRSYPGSGTTWTDLSGNGNSGTLTNGPTYDTGSLGSISFDGINDYCDVGNTLTNGFTEMTISVFAKTITLSAFEYIITKYSFFSDSGWTLYTTPDGALGFDMRNDTSTYRSVRTTQTYEANKYFHMTAVRELTRMVIYVNGAQAAEAAITSGQTNQFDNTRKLAMGALLSDTTTSYSQITIANCSIYNRALSQEEIKQNFNALRGRYGI